MNGLSLLTPEQLDRYRKDGFLVLEGFCDGAACDVLRARATELVRAFEPGALKTIFTTDRGKRKSDDYFLDSGDDVRFFFEEEAFGPDGALVRPKDEAINKIGHALHDKEPEFDRFSRTPKLAALVKDLGVVDPLLMQSMYIFKQPFIGGEVRCHQDATFLHTEPHALVGMWFALEDAHQGNGCLWAIPGGHRFGLKSRFVRTPERTTRFETIDDSPWDDSKLVPIEVKKGALVLLDGLVPHMSLANRSPRSRHAYTLHVIDGESAYPETNWLRRAPGFPPRGFAA